LGTILPGAGERFPVYEVVTAEYIPRIAAPLMADLKELSCSPGGPDHLSSAIESVGHLLFTVNV
jgi:hypothetical protein